MYHLTEIADKVRMVYVHSEKYKTAVIDFSMAVPLDEYAAANALMLSLLKRSSKDYPDVTIMNSRLEELYGASVCANVSKIGDAQVLSLSMNCLDDRFSLDDESIIEDCINLLTGIIFRPNLKGTSFGSDNLSLEKRLAVQSAIEEQNDKRTYALIKCEEHMCPNEPYGRRECGSIEEIESVKLSDVYNAWKRVLSEAIVQITVVGNVNEDKISELFRDKFASIERKPNEINTIFFKKGKFKRAEETEKINQGKLVIGYRTGMENKMDNFYAERVMVDIFGGGTYSKLFSNIREKQSLAYYCSARLNSSKGIVFVQSGIDSDKEKAVTRGIVDQLDEVRNGTFTDEILEASKKSLKEGLTFSSPNAFCGWYSRQIMDEIINPETMKDGIDKVTKDDVCAAAKKMSIDTIFMLKADPDNSEDKSDEN